MPGSTGAPAGRGVRSLPDFPWDSLVPYREVAARHPDGVVDLSVGTPVDPTPEVIRHALENASDAHGYPLTYGTAPLREAVSEWFERRRGVAGVDPAGVLPTIGSKEFVAWLPTLLGLGRGDVVGIPAVAYPTYDVGARIAGAEPVVVDGLAAFGPPGAGRTPKLLWVNSPGNPTGKVLGVEHLAKVVAWARANGVIVASDECYAELDWREPSPLAAATVNEDEPAAVALAEAAARPTSVPSILDDRVCGGDHTGLLAVYSLSKQSNLAGYRAAFVAGDVDIVTSLLEVRKHAGMMMPAPVQAAMRVALTDDEHVTLQREVYRRRRERLLPALTGFGFTVDDSEAGLYLWATRGEDCWSSVADLAERGIVVAPGAFYGARGSKHVRVALTGTDEAVASAAARLAG